MEAVASSPRRLRTNVHFRAGAHLAAPFTLKMHKNQSINHNYFNCNDFIIMQCNNMNEIAISHVQTEKKKLKKKKFNLKLKKLEFKI